MPVQFLSPEQRANYGQYAGDPNPDDLTRYFHLDEADHLVIGLKRGDHNRLGYALQLTTARFLGTFLENPIDVPDVVLQTLVRQLKLVNLEQLSGYRNAAQRWEHTAEIRELYGFSDWTNPTVGFRLSRWLYALCWTGTEQPSVLFDRATTWMLAHKVLLPGCTVLERFVARLRTRVADRLWKRLGQGISKSQQVRLDDLLTIPPEGRRSWLDKLRTGPAHVSGRSLVKSLKRLKTVRDLDIKLPATGVPSSRLSSLARFAGTAKVTAIKRLPPVRRLATLVAFIHCLEATAQDDVIEVLDALLHDFFTAAAKADRKTRLRSMKDLDQAATVLAIACQTLLDPEIEDSDLRNAVFNHTPSELLSQALESVNALVRPPDDVYYSELNAGYRAVRIYLPTLLQHIRFGASPAGRSVVAGFDWLHANETRIMPLSPAPEDVISKPWRRHVFSEDGSIDPRAYTFCVLDGLRKALRRRDVFVSPSWRYADPRAGLLTGTEWENTRPIICRSLGLSTDPKPALSDLSHELIKHFVLLPDVWKTIQRFDLRL